jgi:hypothetical protein
MALRYPLSTGNPSSTFVVFGKMFKIVIHEVKLIEIPLQVNRIGYEKRSNHEINDKTRLLKQRYVYFNQSV